MKIYKDYGDGNLTIDSETLEIILKEKFTFEDVLNVEYREPTATLKGCLTITTKKQKYEFFFLKESLEEAKELYNIFETKLAERNNTSTNPSTVYEIRRKCNVCEKIYCYSTEDLNENTLKPQASIKSNTSNISYKNGGRVVDYPKCPSCSSIDTDEIGIIELKKIISKKVNTNQNYTIEYLDENAFKKQERALKKYNMLAYKKLQFEFYPALRNCEFLGEKINENNEEGTITYELALPTDSMFAKVYGITTLHYNVDIAKKIILLTKITSENIFNEDGIRKELTTYKGIPISESQKSKDMFKINLLNMLNDHK